MIKTKNILQIGFFSKKLLSEFISKWRYFGFWLAWYNFIWWLCFYIRQPFRWRLSSWAMKRKTSWLDKYIEKNYADILEKYKNNRNLKTENASKHIIWVFWGQGESQMPHLIKACYRQLTTYNDNVVLITNENVSKYIHLIDIIYKKVGDGHISWAHFSDIVRTTLLAQYGGLWLDATVWVSGKIQFNMLEQMPLYSANGKVSVTNKSVCFWTSFEWNWSSWCLFANCVHYQLFDFVSEMLQAIAVNENYWPDYVIQDYLIYYACIHFPMVKNDMDNCQLYESKYRNHLANLMNMPYDEKIYKDLIKSDFVFKLSFRSPWMKQTSDGRMTFYGRILDGCI